MSDFMIPVKTEVSPAHYKRLHAAATKHKTTVGALIAELVRRGLAPAPLEGKPRGGGRRSNYTTELGEKVYEARRFRRSYTEIGAELSMAPDTAQRYMRRYEAEIRTAAMAETAQQGREGKAS